RLVFQVGMVVHGLAMGGMALSGSVNEMIGAQAEAGPAAGAAGPAVVVLIAEHYRGQQPSHALGDPGGGQASAGVLALLVVGVLGAALSWRYAFGLLLFIAGLVLGLSFKLGTIKRISGIQIDFVGAILAAASITLISLGFNNLNSWGFLLATPDAPFNLF